MLGRNSLKIMLILIRFLVIINLVWSQTASDVFPAVVFLQGHKGVKTTTIKGQEVEVWIKKGDTKPEPLNLSYSGSGFIVSKESNLYIITASHVSKVIPFDSKVTLFGSKGTPLTYDLSELCGGDTPEWISHNEADIAVLSISPPDNFRAAIRAVSYDQLTAERSAPNLDNFLTTVGFPLELGIKDKFSPIVKVSHSASTLFRHPRFDNNIEASFYILDDPSVSGFSGAPVFNLPTIKVGAMSSGQGAFKCVGIVHGTFNDPTGGKFAAIIPAFYIVELIDMVYKK